MWLKMYLHDVFLDKALVEFENMDTTKERQHYLERLARQMYNDNYITIITSGITPIFYMHLYSDMNLTGFKTPSWEEIIQAVGSKQAKQNIEDMCMKLMSNEF